MEESSNNNTAASSVAQAIAVAFDCSSTPDARKAAVAFLESILGDLRSSSKCGAYARPSCRRRFEDINRPQRPVDCHNCRLSRQALRLLQDLGGVLRP
ncbi:hypothetical protein EV2_032236 [Malus domestica]